MNSNIVVLSTKNQSFICTVDGKASKIRNCSTSPIKFTIFSIFSQYAYKINENYWVDLFANASRGSFHKGYKFIDGKNLTIKISNVIQKCDVIPSDESEIPFYYEKCKEFFIKTSGISSNLDEDVTFIPKKETDKKNNCWSGTIQASRQIVMIKIFADEVSDKYNLNEEKKEELLENLIAHIYMGNIGNSDIKSDGFTIESIDNLELFDGGFNIRIKNTKPSRKKTQKTPVIIENNAPTDGIFKKRKKLNSSKKRN